MQVTVAELWEEINLQSIKTVLVLYNFHTYEYMIINFQTKHILFKNNWIITVHR